MIDKHGVQAETTLQSLQLADKVGKNSLALTAAHPPPASCCSPPQCLWSYLLLPCLHVCIAICAESWKKKLMVGTWLHHSASPCKGKSVPCSKCERTYSFKGLKQLCFHDSLTRLFSTSKQLTLFLAFCLNIPFLISSHYLLSNCILSLGSRYFAHLQTSMLFPRVKVSL